MTPCRRCWCWWWCHSQSLLASFFLLYSLLTSDVVNQLKNVVWLTYLEFLGSSDTTATSWSGSWSNSRLSRRCGCPSAGVDRDPCCFRIVAMIYAVFFCGCDWFLVPGFYELMESGNNSRHIDIISSKFILV